MREFEHSGSSYYKYEEPDFVFIDGQITWLWKMFSDYITQANKSPNDYTFDMDLIIRTVIRCDQRSLHYKMYYNGLNINELKSTAILCYWVLRYRPIIKIKEPSTQNSTIEYFCMWLILGAVKKYRKGKIFKQDDKIMNDVFYYISNRQLSCDSLVVLVESIAKTY